MQQRKLWSKNANAAKERKRLESDLAECIPKSMCPTVFPWIIKITNTMDGESATLRPRNRTHALKAIGCVLSNYVP
jgi:hypothetical protein